MIHLIKSRKYKIKDKEKRKAQEKVTGLTSELIRGIRDIKMLNAKDSFIKVLNGNIKNKNEKYLEMRNLDIAYNLVIDSLTTLFELLLSVNLKNLSTLDLYLSSISQSLSMYSAILSIRTSSDLITSPKPIVSKSK